ncbi:Amino acid transporter ANTL2 [Galdieria sulphuraria]|nr:Amino acid transporter ANTL2 [Galdieria sulphuraria]
MQQRNERTSLLEKTTLGKRVTNLVRGFWKRGEGDPPSGAELRQSPSFDAFQYSRNGKQTSATDYGDSDLNSKDLDMNHVDIDQGTDSATIEEYDEFDVRQSPPGEENPTLEEDLSRSELAKHLVGDIGNMLKAFIGLNFLYVSYAFAHAGLIRGTIGLIVIALITEHCCLLLVQVKNQMPEADDPSFRITYGDLGKYVLGGIGEKTNLA